MRIHMGSRLTRDIGWEGFRQHKTRVALTVFGIEETLTHMKMMGFNPAAKNREKLTEGFKPVENHCRRIDFIDGLWGEDLGGCTRAGARYRGLM